MLSRYRITRAHPYILYIRVYTAALNNILQTIQCIYEIILQTKHRHRQTTQHWINMIPEVYIYVYLLLLLLSNIVQWKIWIFEYFEQHKQSSRHGMYHARGFVISVAGGNPKKAAERCKKAHNIACISFAPVHFPFDCAIVCLRMHRSIPENDHDWMRTSNIYKDIYCRCWNRSVAYLTSRRQISQARS